MTENQLKSNTCFSKGHTPWNKGKKGVQQWSEESRKKASLSHIGKKGNRYWLGKKHSEETKQKISEAQYREKGNNWKGGKRQFCIDCSSLINQTNYGCCRCKSCANKERWKSKEFRDRTGNNISLAIKRKIKDNPEYLECLIKRTVNGRKRLNSLAINHKESTLLNILSSQTILYYFVGDNSFRLGSFNPDFINYDYKAIIELYGDYWHKLDSNKKRDKRRKQCYKEMGYKLLVIWEHELLDIKKLTNKIKRFNQRIIQ